MGDTRDPAEIEKFSRLARQWWDPKGPFAALHHMNPVRLAYVREKAPSGKGKALDIGCGGGLVTLPLHRMGFEVTGIDASDDAVMAARTHAEEAGLDVPFRVATAEVMAAEAPGAFQLITALEIVEHVADPGAFLAACETLLAPGGVLIVSTINRTPQARAFALFAAEKLLHMAPEGAHDFEKLVQPGELSMAAPGLIWDAPVGISFDPIGRTWKRSSDVSINYLRAAAKPAH